MVEWTAKRFWKSADVVQKESGEGGEGEGGFTVVLDGRALKTPAKAPLLLPTLALAQTIAAEWQAQGETIIPASMPATRMANSALDKVAPQRCEVIEEIAGFGAFDLLCYRAETPHTLRMRQAAGWDPLLDWADESFGARLNIAQGIVPITQPSEALARLRAQIVGLNAFELMALHDLVAISGSLVLALATARGRLSAQDAFALSRIDETWQAEQWGVDDEARAHEMRRSAAFHESATFFALCVHSI